MVEEVLVNEALSREMISAGDDLAKLIRESKIKTSAMMWLYLSDMEDWRFIIVSPEVKTVGPKKLYEQIDKILAKLPDDRPQISSEYVFVLSPDDFRVSPFRTVKVKGKPVSGKRYRRTVMDGVFIDDSYVYSLT